MIKSLPEKLSDLLQIGKITIFTVSYCGYCDSAISMLKKIKVDYQCLECDTEKITSQQTQDLHKLSGFRTYPKIFVSKNCIGGCDDLESQINSGKFFELLNKEKILFTKAKF